MPEKQPCNTIDPLPMELAPRDGTEVLVYMGSGPMAGYRIACWFSDALSTCPKPRWHFKDSAWQDITPLAWWPLVKTPMGINQELAAKRKARRQSATRSTIAAALSIYRNDDTANHDADAKKDANG